MPDTFHRARWCLSYAVGWIAGFLLYIMPAMIRAFLRRAAVPAGGLVGWLVIAPVVVCFTLASVPLLWLNYLVRRLTTRTVTRHAPAGAARN